MAYPWRKMCKMCSHVSCVHQKMTLSKHLTKGYEGSSQSTSGPRRSPLHTGWTRHHMTIGLVLILRRIIQKLQSMNLPTFWHCMLPCNARLPSSQLLEDVNFGNCLVEIKVHVLHKSRLFCFGSLWFNRYSCSFRHLRYGFGFENSTETFWRWRWSFALGCCIANTTEAGGWWRRHCRFGCGCHLLWSNCTLGFGWGFFLGSYHGSQLLQFSSSHTLPLWHKDTATNAFHGSYLGSIVFHQSSLICAQTCLRHQCLNEICFGVWKLAIWRTFQFGWLVVLLIKFRLAIECAKKAIDLFEKSQKTLFLKKETAGPDIAFGDDCELGTGCFQIWEETTKLFHAFWSCKLRYQPSNDSELSTNITNIGRLKEIRRNL